MPHLDAGALSIDAEGLEFLGKVLDVRAEVLPAWRPADLSAKMKLRPRIRLHAEVNRPRRFVPIPEAV